MSNIQQFSSKDDIRLQACEWISKLDRGLSSSEEKHFANWINTSQAHRDDLFEMAKTWDNMSALHQLSGLFPLHHGVMPKRQTWFGTYTPGLAASFIFVFLGVLGWFLHGQFNAEQHLPNLLNLTAETAIGEHRQISLNDGSVIHLNTNSMVAVEFTQQQRNIKLIKGEAHFDVAHDIERPFVVHANNSSVTAVGTAFNIQIAKFNDVELIVTEGKVLVKNSQTDTVSGQQNDQLLATGELMTAGHKALISPDKVQKVSFSQEQIQQDLAWQQGMLVFHGEPLAEALNEISRYTAISFDLADEQVKQRRVAGYFKAGDIQGLLFALENNFNITYEQTNDKTIVLSSGT
ncbi:FecR family protein [Paraglaciecola aestuariivivens]